MKVNGIIAEYNPFHNGHKYQLEESRRQTGADYTIIAMSGNFMQRGAPAILDKYKRAEMALLNGADLILEIPSCYAASSAEFFATGAVSLLDKLGVVDYLCFGSECGKLSLLQEIADILLQEPEEYSRALRSFLRQGYSYPMARLWALHQYAPSLNNENPIMSSPNNILGIEYLKALARRHSRIIPYTTLRAGSAYHDKRLGAYQSSALAIRETIFSSQDFDLLKNQMPDSAYEIMSRSMVQSRPVQLNDFSAVLHYKLLMEYDKGYDKYLDVSSDLSDRIRKTLIQFKGFDSFCALLKSKELTYTRINRGLLHILLNIDKDTLVAYKEMDYIPYARVLGFRREAAPLLTAIKDNSSIPFITKLSEAEKLLDEKAYAMFQQELLVNNVYQSALALKSKSDMVNEFSTPLVII